jgi:hypothetical protein
MSGRCLKRTRAINALEYDGIDKQITTKDTDARSTRLQAFVGYDSNATFGFRGPRRPGQCPGRRSVGGHVPHRAEQLRHADGLLSGDGYPFSVLEGVLREGADVRPGDSTAAGYRVPNFDWKFGLPVQRQRVLSSSADATRLFGKRFQRPDGCERLCRTARMTGSKFTVG